MVLAFVLAFVGWLTLNQQQASQPKETVRPAATSQTSPASEALGRLAVRERVSHEGYSRSRFGSGWASAGGCDTRNRILQRDLHDVKADSDGCIVLAGTLKSDPYTDKTVIFKRGKSTSQAVQIDHIVALADSWQKGAQELDAEKRRQFANDPLNLLAVDGPANMEKGAGDAAEWLPQKSYRCRYVARQIAVKLKYMLWVTRAEHGAMNRVLATCPGQVLPVEGSH